MINTFVAIDVHQDNCARKPLLVMSIEQAKRVEGGDSPPYVLLIILRTIQ